MTDVKHTPGVWKYTEMQLPHNQEWLGCGVADGDDEFVWLEDNPKIDIPRAHLIAAAPDMLDSHKENARILGFLVNELQGIIPAGKLEALHKCQDRSQAAIAKAKSGE